MALHLSFRPPVAPSLEVRGKTTGGSNQAQFGWGSCPAASAAVAVLAGYRRQSRYATVRHSGQTSKMTPSAMEKWSARRSLAVVGFLGAAAFTVLVRMLHSGSGRASWGTFAERVRAYNGVCGSLGADLAFSFAAFVAFAVCAGTETAITTLWPWKVREYAQREWDKAEQRVRELRESGGRFVTAKVQLGKWTALREDIGRFMQTILIGATLAGVVSTAFITEICGQLFGPKGLGIATVSVTLVQLTLGEILPKSMAVSSPYNFAQATLPFFYRISTVVYPVSRVLNEAVARLLGMIGVPVDTNKTPFVSEEELDLVFRSAMQSGVVAEEEGEMIASVRNLDSKKIKEIMTPLVDMICIESQEPVSKLHHLIKSTQFSRIPVYEVRFDNIIGVVSLKTLLKNAASIDLIVTKNNWTVSEICDTPVFVPETMSLIAALRLLKERTLAICVDEYGGTTGLVTLEDVLEEIVGEIYDPDEEKDEVERQQNQAKIQQIEPDRFSMSGLAEKCEVEEALGVKMPDGDYNSIGGFMLLTIDRIPRVGEACIVETAAERIRLEISKVDERRVLQIEAFRQRKEMGEDEDPEKNQVIFTEVDLLDVILPEKDTFVPDVKNPRANETAGAASGSEEDPKQDEIQSEQTAERAIEKEDAVEDMETIKVDETAGASESKEDSQKDEVQREKSAEAAAAEKQDSVEDVETLKVDGKPDSVEDVEAIKVDETAEASESKADSRKAEAQNAKSAETAAVEKKDTVEVEDVEAMKVDETAGASESKEDSHKDEALSEKSAEAAAVQTQDSVEDVEAIKVDETAEASESKADSRKAEAHNEKSAETAAVEKKDTVGDVEAMKVDETAGASESKEDSKQDEAQSETSAEAKAVE